MYICTCALMWSHSMSHSCISHVLKLMRTSDVEHMKELRHLWKLTSAAWLHACKYTHRHRHTNTQTHRHTKNTQRTLKHVYAFAFTPCSEEKADRMPYHCRSLSSNRPYYKRLDCRKKTGKDKVFYGYGFSPRAKHKREHILLVDYGMPTISGLLENLGLFCRI